MTGEIGQNKGFVDIGGGFADDGGFGDVQHLAEREEYLRVFFAIEGVSTCRAGVPLIGKLDAGNVYGDFARRGFRAGGIEQDGARNAFCISDNRFQIGVYFQTDRADVLGVFIIERQAVRLRSNGSEGANEKYDPCRERSVYHAALPCFRNRLLYKKLL